jgi:hypothetical protein
LKDGIQLLQIQTIDNICCPAIPGKCLVTKGKNGVELAGVINHGEKVKNGRILS